MKTQKPMVLLLLTIGLLVCQAARATDDKGAARAGSGPDSAELDISDVQAQYWKAHDKKFEVIQNRLYTKKGRLEISPVFGIYQRVDYQDAKAVGLGISYHFSELLGVEVMGQKIFASDSMILQKFQNETGTTIEYNKEQYAASAALIFTPIYAKFSFLGQKISHFDLFVSPGVGITKTTTNNLTLQFGVGQKFWLTPRWNIRAEYRWSHYTNQVEATRGALATRSGGSGSFDDTVNNYNLLLGVSFLY